MQEAVEALWKDAEAMGTAARKRGRKRLFLRDAGRDAGGENGYLLPIVRDGGPHARSAYRNVQYKVNQGLKEIGKMLGLKILTSSTRTPKFISKQWSDTLMPFHKLIIILAFSVSPCVS